MSDVLDEAIKILGDYLEFGIHNENFNRAVKIVLLGLNDKYREGYRKGYSKGYNVALTRVKKHNR